MYYGIHSIDNIIIYNHIYIYEMDVMASRSTLRGTAGSFLKRTEIYSQDASILGWTCGNLIAPAGSAAEPRQLFGT